mgnify:CR=1 FL=1
MAAVLGFIATVAHAAADFPATLEEDGLRLTRAGTAVVRFAGILPLFDAVLYLADPADAGRVLDDVPKRLVIRYRRAIPPAALNHAAERALRATTRAGELDPVRDRLDRIAAWYRAVEPGDVYALTYVPGAGTRLELNGRAVGTVDGADFARIYFGVWLHPRAPHGGLREDLLGAGNARGSEGG